MASIRTEKTDSENARKDVAIFDDARVLNDLLQVESIYMPKCDYFKNVQTEAEVYTRKIVTKWMLEVCEELKCEDQVFPLAVNIFDRFLCLCDTPKKFLQLIAAVCLLISSKMRQTVTISVNALCYYTNYSITATQMRNYEVTLLTKLNWDMAGVTAFDFVDHILQRTKCTKNMEKVRTHAIILLHLCYTEYDFMLIKPSLIAISSCIAAIRGLKIKLDVTAYEKLCQYTKVDMRVVEETINAIEWIVSKESDALNMKKCQNQNPAENTGPLKEILR